MSFMSSFSGTVTAKFIGADIPGTLDLFSRYGIAVLHFHGVTELEGIVRLKRSDFRRALKICKTRGDQLELQSRGGTYWMVKALLSRPVLFAGILLYLLAALYLPSRVFFVRVTGNSRIPSRLILEAASDCGISFGASRRWVRSEKMKNTLLEAIPQLQWAGVNTYGCVAEISVRERAVWEMPEAESDFGHIVAGREGVIISCDVTKGNLLCVPGQAVGKGEILISGYTDCGLTIRAEQAQGEIFAATKRSLSVIAPDRGYIEAQTDAVKKKISLLIGKKRINLWKDSGIWDTTCDRMYEDYYITLPGGFQLPFGWCMERFGSRALTEQIFRREFREKLLADAAEDYLKDQMLSGTIQKSSLTFEEGDGFLQMTGQYDCVEMIGFMQRLEIGE